MTISHSQNHRKEDCENYYHLTTLPITRFGGFFVIHPIYTSNRYVDKTSFLRHIPKTCTHYKHMDSVNMPTPVTHDSLSNAYELLTPKHYLVPQNIQPVQWLNGNACTDIQYKYPTQIPSPQNCLSLCLGAVLAVQLRKAGPWFCPTKFYPAPAPRGVNRRPCSIGSGDEKIHSPKGVCFLPGIPSDRLDGHSHPAREVNDLYKIS